MKKIISILVVMLLFSTTYAQSGYTTGNDKRSSKNSSNEKDAYNSIEAHRVVFGITAGPTLNWFNWKNHRAAPEGYERSHRGALKVGARYGLNIDVDLNLEKHFFVSTGVFIEHTGGSLQFSDNLNILGDIVPKKLDREYRSTYVTIPTAITLRTPSFSNFIICGNVGFYHSFNIYARYKSSFQLDDNTFDDSDKEIINHLSTDWAKDKEVALFKESVFAGLGFEYVIRNNFKVKFMVNYAQSLNNFYKKSAVNSYTNVKEKASIGTVEFLFGFYF